MNIRTLSIVAGAAMLLAGKPAPSAAAPLPPALAKTGTVCHFSSHTPGGEHGHGLDKWKLKAGRTRLAIHERFSGARYIDVLWSWPNELQDPDLLVVNPESNPVLSQEEFPNGCVRDVRPDAFTAAAHIPDFVFAFAIDDIRNPPGSVEPSSPHAIVYLPINTGHAPASSAQEFQLLLFHMERSASDCPAAAGEDRDQCIALWELRTKWEAAGQSAEGLQQDMADRIRKILKVRTAVRKSLPVRFRSAYSTFFLALLLYHNGVIHGTL